MMNKEPEPEKIVRLMFQSVKTPNCRVPERSIFFIILFILAQFMCCNKQLFTINQLFVIN